MAIKKYDALYINDYPRINSLSAQKEIGFFEKTLRLKLLNYETHNEKKSSINTVFSRLSKCHQVICTSEFFKNPLRSRVILYALSKDIPVLLLKNNTMFHVFVNYDRQEGLSLFIKDRVL